MAEAVYILCALASFACAFLLFRSYKKARTQLVLWSAICFLGLAANNVLLFVDLIIVPEVNLAPWRILPGLIGAILFVHNVVEDSR